jgi:hypothetical membrane protein
LEGRALALVGAVGAIYFALTILLLSLFDPDYSPISQVASDYGVGRYALEMNLGFLVGGVGLIAFAVGLAKEAGRLRSRAGASLMFVAGSVLVINSYFTADLEGAALTFHGTVHAFGGLFFFVCAPIGVLLVTRKLGRRAFLATLLAVLFGFGLLAVGPLLSLDAGGLAERVIIWAVLLPVAFTSTGLSGT